MALDLVGQFAGISQRERRIDGQRHLRVEPMTEAPGANRLHPADALGVLGRVAQLICPEMASEPLGHSQKKLGR